MRLCASPQTEDSLLRDAEEDLLAEVVELRERLDPGGGVVSSAAPALAAAASRPPRPDGRPPASSRTPPAPSIRSSDNRERSHVARSPVSGLRRAHPSSRYRNHRCPSQRNRRAPSAVPTHRASLTRNARAPSINRRGRSRPSERPPMTSNYLAAALMILVGVGFALLLTAPPSTWARAGRTRPRTCLTSAARTSSAARAPASR